MRVCVCGLAAHGNGLNNFRDWEALIAGAAIPLVDHYEHSADLWRELPVVRVKNWSTVTPNFLRETGEVRGSCTTGPRPCGRRLGLQPLARLPALLALKNAAPSG